MSDTTRARGARLTTLGLIAGLALFVGVNVYSLVVGGSSWTDLIPGLSVGVGGAAAILAAVFLVVRRRGARVQRRLRGYDAGVVCQPAFDVVGSVWVLAVEGDTFRVFRVDKTMWVPVATCRASDARLTRTDVTFNGFRRLPGIRVTAGAFEGSFGILRPSLFAAHTRAAAVDRAVAPLAAALRA